MNKSDIVKQQSDFILYTGNYGKVNIDVFVQNETASILRKYMQKEDWRWIQRFGNSEQFKLKDRGKLKEIWNTTTSMPSSQ